MVLAQRYNPPDDRDTNRPGHGGGSRRSAPDQEDSVNHFWGGPYWGYGARFGHPCRWCRANCTESDEPDDKCKRCISRCGL